MNTENAWVQNAENRLQRIEEKIKDDPRFDSEDEAALRELILALQGFRIFGRFAKWVVYLLAAIAGGITAWNTIISQMRSYWGE